MSGLLVAATLLTACGTDGGGDLTTTAADETTSLAATHDASATAAPPETPADSATPGSPVVRADTGPSTGRGSGGAPIVLTDVRVADHERFDRIVLEFSGAGRPGWTADYVDDAVLEGSGDVVGLGGDSILDIYASHTTWPAPGYYSGPQRLEAEDGRLTEVYVAGTFEGYTQVLAGIDGARAPFRVFTLSHPSRLVVDVVEDTAG